MKVCKCGIANDNPSGMCMECLRKSAERFWQFVNRHRAGRFVHIAIANIRSDILSIKDEIRRLAAKIEEVK